MPRGCSPSQRRSVVHCSGEASWSPNSDGEVDVLPDVPDGELLVEAVRDRQIAGLQDRVVEGRHRIRRGLARGRGLERPRAVGAVERVEELADRVADGGVEGAAVAGQRLRHTLAVGVERPARQRVRGVADLALELGPAGLRSSASRSRGCRSARRAAPGRRPGSRRGSRAAAAPATTRAAGRAAAPRSPSLRDGQGTTGARRGDRRRHRRGTYAGSEERVKDVSPRGSALCTGERPRSSPTANSGEDSCSRSASPSPAPSPPSPPPPRRSRPTPTAPPRPRRPLLLELAVAALVVAGLLARRRVAQLARASWSRVKSIRRQPRAARFHQR